MNSVSFSLRSPERHARIVAQVVGVAHESVHRAERVALSSGQQHKAVVEILRRRTRDMAAYTVGGSQSQFGVLQSLVLILALPSSPSMRPATARKTSSTFRNLLKLGRRASTL